MWRYAQGVGGAGQRLFLVVVSGSAAVLVPWWLTDGWQAGDRWLPLRLLGLVPLAAGTAVILEAFTRFTLEGLGTPAPVAPPARLVVSGPYRYVRNPIYLAVVAVLCGQGLLLARPALFVYAAGLGLDTHLGVRPPGRGAGAGAPVRRGVRALPAGGAGLVATAHAVAGHLRTRRARHGNCPCTGGCWRRHLVYDTSHQFVVWTPVETSCFSPLPGTTPHRPCPGSGLVPGSRRAAPLRPSVPVRDRGFPAPGAALPSCEPDPAMRGPRDPGP
ncbi:methyltransferase [Streptomyces sp. BK340]|uniref:methyltransferase family protein n=1 Tax=Streptomyces sp. BK340 TaxID=2572903 RepID=UPI0028F6C1F0|nr:methyltransferase [Streptomyces sp. BK340]